MVAMVLDIREFINNNGKSPFADWFYGLDTTTAVKVTSALKRVELGNMANVQGVGGSVLEYRIHYGAGIRIYFGKDGDALIILLGGGIKRTQQKDIEIAKIRWQEYKKRKRRRYDTHAKI